MYNRSHSGRASARQCVDDQFIKDKQSAASFIAKKWPVDKRPRSAQIDMNSYITYAVSTTLESSLLLIAKGSETMFTRNTCSVDPGNPWLIFQHAQENQALARHVQEKWEKLTIHPNGNREEVDKIAAHVLYQRKGSNWVLVPLPSADDKNVIRYEAGNTLIWSHPPRDKALTKVLRKVENFSQVEEDLKLFCEEWTDMKNDEGIPEDEKEGALAQQRDKIKEKFLEMYGFYTNLKPLPNSYLWPTLQLGIRNADGSLQRHRGTYTTFTNEVHHKFCASGVKKRPLPEMETVYDNFKSSLAQFDLNFEDMKIKKIIVQHL